jgi:metal-dependent hydrolase (beta-lactamase superfamily II)
MNDALTIISFFVGVLSLVYAVITNREKAKLEKVIKMRLLNISESVEDVVNNAALAHTHIDATRQFLNDLERSKGLKTILDRIAWAEADITAAHRMSKRLKRDVDSLQEGLFFKGKIPSNKEPKNTKLIDASKDEDAEDS